MVAVLVRVICTYQVRIIRTICPFTRSLSKCSHFFDLTRLIGYNVFTDIYTRMNDGGECFVCRFRVECESRARIEWESTACCCSSEWESSGSRVSIVLCVLTSVPSCICHVAWGSGAVGRRGMTTKTTTATNKNNERQRWFHTFSRFYFRFRYQ